MRERGAAKRVQEALARARWGQWWNRQARESVAVSSELAHEPLLVLELEVDETLGRLPWEDAIRPWPVPVDAYWLATTVVRRCPVPSRAEAWPLTLPLRALQVGSTLPSIEERVDSLFEWSPTSRRLVLEGASCPPGEFASWMRASAWPSIDVCEVGVETREDPSALMSAADPERLGSLGWLERLCHEMHVRLLILLPEDDRGSAETARAMARRLSDRGGPAVLVASPQLGPGIDDVYREIVHDRPLDWIVSSRSEVLDERRFLTLFADPSRAEALRVSSAFRPLVDLTEQLVSDPGQLLKDPEVSEQLSYLTELSPVPSPEWLVRAWGVAGGELLTEWGQSSWNLHESDGVLPMQRAVLKLRQALRLNVIQVPRRPASTDPIAPNPLVVTPRVAQADASGHSRPIAQLDDEIERYRPFLVGLGVGPYDRIAVADAAALLQEAVFSDPGAPAPGSMWPWSGSVAPSSARSSSGCGCRARGASENTTFVVHPGRRRSWRVRLCLYHNNLLLQSILVAGVSGPADSEDRRRLLARQLVMQPDDIPTRATWLAKTEYTLTGEEMERLPGATRRAVSITANSIEGQRVLMFKGDDLGLEVRLNGDVKVLVEGTREELAAVSTPPVPGVLNPANLVYGFSADNSAPPGRYDAAMIALAGQGWTLFEGLVPQDSREQLVASLADAGAAVHNGSILSVSHLVLEKVVPWSLVYDRYFDKRGTEQVACHALHPAPSCHPGVAPRHLPPQRRTATATHEPQPVAG